MLYKETVTKGTLEMIHTLMNDTRLNDFYLVGGTALSLQLGHRISVDIDLFSREEFDKKALIDHMKNTYDPDYIRMMVHGVAFTKGMENMDFFYYPAPLIKPVQVIEGIRMLSVEDIAAMKINAISLQGERVKDYADIYAVLEKRSLNDIIEVYSSKYKGFDARADAAMIAVHGDVQFKQAKMMDKSISWEQVSQRLKDAVSEPDKIFGSVNQGVNQKKSARHPKGKHL